MIILPSGVVVVREQVKDGGLWDSGGWGLGGAWPEGSGRSKEKWVMVANSLMGSALVFWTNYLKRGGAGKPEKKFSLNSHPAECVYA